jgi:hypothetical protein
MLLLHTYFKTLTFASSLGSRRIRVIYCTI